MKVGVGMEWLECHSKSTEMQLAENCQILNPSQFQDMLTAQSASLSSGIQLLDSLQSEELLAAEKSPNTCLLEFLSSCLSESIASTTTQFSPSSSFPSPPSAERLPFLTTSGSATPTGSFQGDCTRLARLSETFEDEYDLQKSDEHDANALGPRSCVGPDRRTKSDIFLKSRLSPECSATREAPFSTPPALLGSLSPMSAPTQGRMTPTTASLHSDDGIGHTQTPRQHAPAPPPNALMVSSTSDFPLTVTPRTASNELPVSWGTLDRQHDVVRSGALPSNKRRSPNGVQEVQGGVSIGEKLQVAPPVLQSSNHFSAGSTLPQYQQQHVLSSAPFEERELPGSAADLLSLLSAAEPDCGRSLTAEDMEVLLSVLPPQATTGTDVYSSPPPPLVASKSMPSFQQPPPPPMHASDILPGSCLSDVAGQLQRSKLEQLLAEQHLLGQHGQLNGLSSGMSLNQPLLSFQDSQGISDFSPSSYVGGRMASAHADLSTTTRVFNPPVSLPQLSDLANVLNASGLASALAKHHAAIAAQQQPPKKVYSDDRDRMVYVSWIPKKGRAYNATDKRKMELDLKQKLRDMGLVGLTKVLLFPPKGVHCKLIFDSRQSAAIFMAKYGGENCSVETETWKSDMCKLYDIDMHEKFDKTVVKIEWSQK